MQQSISRVLVENQAVPGRRARTAQATISINAKITRVSVTHTVNRGAGLESPTQPVPRSRSLWVWVGTLCSLVLRSERVCIGSDR